MEKKRKGEEPGAARWWWGWGRGRFEQGKAQPGGARGALRRTR